MTGECNHLVAEKTGICLHCGERVMKPKETHSEQRTSREISNANLKPYQPGQSGNPEGRPPDTLTPLLRKFLNADNEAEKIAIVRELIGIAKTKGMRGQIAALREIFDRIDGKVPETHKIESDVPIIIQPTVYERREDAVKQGEG